MLEAANTSKNLPLVKMICWSKVSTKRFWSELVLPPNTDNYTLTIRGIMNLTINTVRLGNYS